MKDPLIILHYAIGAVSCCKATRDCCPVLRQMTQTAEGFSKHNVKNVLEEGFCILFWFTKCF